MERCVPATTACLLIAAAARMGGGEERWLVAAWAGMEKSAMHAETVVAARRAPQHLAI